MTTPLVMVALLVGPYVAARVLRQFDSRTAAAYGLSLLFVFTGLGHFLQTEAMAQMLPPWVPARVPLVHLTGVLEWGLALGFFIPETRRSAGWMALAVLVAFFPVNVYAAFNYVPMGGHAWGPEYLLVRAPVQLAILLWTYWFTVSAVTRGADRETLPAPAAASMAQP